MLLILRKTLQSDMKSGLFFFALKQLLFIERRNQKEHFNKKPYVPFKDIAFRSCGRNHKVYSSSLRTTVKDGIQGDCYKEIVFNLYKFKLTTFLGS